MSTYGDSVRLLDSLPPRSVVLDCDMDAWQKDDEGLWSCTVRAINTHEMGAESVAILGVLSVVYRAPEDAETESVPASPTREEPNNA